MEVQKRFFSTLNSFTTSEPSTFPTIGLFISEYIEGSSNNKAIEIYNGTGAIIDLKNYAVVLLSNGSDAIGNNLTFNSKIELSIGETYVIANSAADSAILLVADTTSSVTFFNGDDDLAIMTRANFDTRTLQFIDYFGQRSVDPGSFYEGGGVKTQNQTLRRKVSITQGDTNDSDVFDPSLEWDQFDIDDFTDLGKHNSSNTNVFAFSTEPSISNISAKSASIAFETNDSATAIVYYGETTSYTDSIIFNDLNTSFNSLILGLDVSTEYHVLVKAIQDSTDEIIFSNAITFATLDTGIASGILFPGLYGQPLITALRDSFRNHTDLGYDGARDQMFGFVDNYNDTVYLVYTGFPFEHSSGTGRPNTASTNVNTEHTWPQSKGASDIRKSDIHHLFGTFEAPNGARGSNRFNDITDNRTEKWWISNTAITSKPLTNVDAYSESISSEFEPREVQKGNTARAMFYFYTMYQNDGIDTTWFRPQTEKLKEWHLNDPVDSREITRNSRVKQVQGNENPFIIDASLVERILSNQPAAFNFSVNPTAKNITDSSATISFLTNSLATAKVLYGETNTNTDSVILGTAAFSFNIGLNSLNAATEYHYKVFITKSGSSESKESSDLTFTTDSALGFTTIDNIVDNFSTYDGKTVKITGILLNDFGNLQSSRTNIYIVSNSGKAINVNSSVKYEGLNRADSVIIKGTISRFNDIYQINPTEQPIVADSLKSIPEPITTTVSAIKNLVHHGNYVRLLATVVDKYNTGNSGTNIDITDGTTDTITVRVWSSTGINTDSVLIGNTYSFYGATGAFGGSGQILPSVQTDIVIGDDKPEELSFSQEPDVSNITDQTVSIVWSTNLSSTARINYGVGNLDQISSVSLADTTFSVSLTTLLANTTYQYQITVFNQSDSLKSSVKSFKTTADPFIVTVAHESYHYSTESSLSNIVRYNIGFSADIAGIVFSKAIFKTDTQQDTTDISFATITNKSIYQALFKANKSGDLTFLTRVKDQLKS
jgi:endonuclease I